MHGGFDWHSHGHPLERLLAHHRRIERCLANLAALPAHIAAHGAGAESAASAAAILHCFGELTRQHAREEGALMPLLERRIRDAGERVRFRAARRKLASEHREIEAAWRGLRRPLDALAEGVRRPLDAVAILRLRTLCAAHIASEEALLHRVCDEGVQCHDSVTALTSG